MKCKHCGKELIAVTMYIEAGAFNVAAQPAVPNAAWPPTNDVVWWNLSAAAAAPCYTPTVFPCAHEPAVEPLNTTGGNYE